MRSDEKRCATLMAAYYHYCVANNIEIFEDDLSTPVPNPSNPKKGLSSAQNIALLKVIVANALQDGP